MQIYIIRHAIAELREDWDRPDEERPLTTQGRKKMIRIARGLAALGVCFSEIYTSPLVRAQQTAKILQKNTKCKSLKQTDLLAPEAVPAAILSLLNEHEESEALALVGHEPHVSTLLSFLLTGANDHLTTFKKGGVALLECDKPVAAARCVLRWLMAPKQLTALCAQ